MGPKERRERYNVDMVGRTPTVLTRREKNSGYEDTEESGAGSKTCMDAGGM